MILKTTQVVGGITFTVEIEGTLAEIKAIAPSIAKIIAQIN